jgi:hypothetical protein
MKLEDQISIGVIDRGNRQTIHTNAATIHNSKSGEIREWKKIDEKIGPKYG